MLSCHDLVCLSVAVTQNQMLSCHALVCLSVAVTQTKVLCHVTPWCVCLWPSRRTRCCVMSYLVCLSVNVRAATDGVAGATVVMTGQPGLSVGPMHGSTVNYWDRPVFIVCQYCHATVYTTIIHTPGNITWLICILLVCFGSVLCMSASSSRLCGQYRMCLPPVCWVSVECVCLILWFCEVNIVCACLVLLFVRSVSCVSAQILGLWGQHVCLPRPLVCGVSVVRVCLILGFVGSVSCVSACGLLSLIHI